MAIIPMPESLKVLRRMETSKDETVPYHLTTSVFEMLDTNTDEVYYCKCCDFNNHTMTNEVGTVLQANINLAKEYLSLAFARAVGVNTCDTQLVYSETMKKCGIMSRKHTENPKSLLSLHEILQRKAPDTESYAYKLAFVDRCGKISKKSIVDMAKMQLCDIITFNSDRHENNIMFTDDTYTEIYPYFDCDYAFNINQNTNLKGITLEMLFYYNLKGFNVFNLASCLSFLIGDEDDRIDADTVKSLALREPDLNYLKDICNEVNLPAEYANYLYLKVFEMNKYMKKVLACTGETMLRQFMQYIPEVQGF